MHYRPTTFKGKPNRHGRKKNAMEIKRFNRAWEGTGVSLMPVSELSKEPINGFGGQYTGFSIYLVDED